MERRFQPLPLSRWLTMRGCEACMSSSCNAVLGPCISAGAMNMCVLQAVRSRKTFASQSVCTILFTPHPHQLRCCTTVPSICPHITNVKNTKAGFQRCLQKRQQQALSSLRASNDKFCFPFLCTSMSCTPAGTTCTHSPHLTLSHLFSDPHPHPLVFERQPIQPC